MGVAACKKEGLTTCKEEGVATCKEEVWPHERGCGHIQRKMVWLHVRKRVWPHASSCGLM